MSRPFNLREFSPGLRSYTHGRQVYLPLWSFVGALSPSHSVLSVLQLFFYYGPSNTDTR